jgi:hypothetical protein
MRSSAAESELGNEANAFNGITQPPPFGFQSCKLAAKPITSPKIHPNVSISGHTGDEKEDAPRQVETGEATTNTSLS